MAEDTLLLIDDDAGMAELLRDYLGRHGYALHWADRPSKGFLAWQELAPKLVLLDVMMPEQDGFSVCREARARGVTTPVIILSAKGADDDRITGLQIGADDYLPKPFNPKELLARIEAVLRRAPAATPEPTGPRLDPDARAVVVAGKQVPLTPHEYRLIERMIRHPGRAFTRDELLDSLDDGEAYDRAIDLHVSRIRQKLEDDPKHPKHLVTVWGVGYRFQ